MHIFMTNFRVMDIDPSSSDENNSISDEDDLVIEKTRDDVIVKEIDKAGLLEPTNGMVFDDADAAISFYKSYAQKIGFGIIKRDSKKNDDGKIRYFTLACSRQGMPQYTSKNTFKPYPSTRSKCPAKVNFYLDGEKFYISIVRLDHNQGLSP